MQEQLPSPIFHAKSKNDSIQPLPLSLSRPDESQKDSEVTLTPSQFMSTLNIDAVGEVTFVAQKQKPNALPLMGLTEHCRILSIAGEAVETRADIRHLLKKLQAEGDTPTVIRFKPPAKSYLRPLDFKSGNTALSGQEFANSILGTPTVPATEHTPQEAIERSAGQARAGQCIIVVCGVVTNAPGDAVREVASRRGEHLVEIDPGKPMALNPRRRETMELIEHALLQGYWILIENATKSITLLTALDELLRGLVGSNLTPKSQSPLWGSSSSKATFSSPPSSDSPAPNASSTVHPNSRLFLVMEPHPHFPQMLLGGCIMLRLYEVRTFDVSSGSLIRETLRDSEAKLKIATRKQQQQEREGGTPLLPSPINRSMTPPRKAGVSFSSKVDVVQLSGDESLNSSTSFDHPVDTDNLSGVRIVKNDVFPFSSERFCCITQAGESRLAVGGSDGNVYILDYNGKPLLTFRAHAGSIWALDFCGRHSFISASEDCTAAEWTHDPSHRVHGFQGDLLVRSKSDLRSTKYCTPGDPSVALVGGMNGLLYVLRATSGSHDQVREKSSIPTISTVLEILPSAPERPGIWTGGGSGVVSEWDIAHGAIVNRYYSHEGRVSAMADGGIIVASASFDGSVAFIDSRISQAIGGFRDERAPVTAIEFCDNKIGVCAEQTLYVYDLRLLTQPQHLSTVYSECENPAVLFRRRNAYVGPATGMIMLPPAKFAAGKGTTSSPGESIAVVVSTTHVRYFGFQ